MKSILTLCVLVAAVVADGPFTGYHDRVGIPLAARIKKAEQAAIRSGSRIVGGQPAPLGAHPYLVGLVIYFEDSGISVCGSSMLSNTRAITAGHCWSDTVRQSEKFTLVFGSEFNHVTYTSVIQPISLPSGVLESSDFVGVWAQASGYGMIGPGISLQPNQVQSHVNLQVLSNDACRVSFGPIVTDKIICTNGAGGVGICSSDSGGPLSIISNNQRVLIGVASFGSTCGNGFPSGFVRVTEHLPWIRERI